MKIIIIGAGQVGGTLAENLSSEENDITVVDINANKLRKLQDRIDIRTVYGHGSHPDILRRAGADDADMLIAVTSSDEVNMVACQVSHSLYKTPTKIGRIRSTSYVTRKGLFNNESIPIDVLISPEQIVTNYIKRLIEYPGALQVLDFADGKVQVVAVKAYYGGPLVNQELRYLNENLDNIPTVVAAIYRDGHAFVPTPNTIIEVDDEVFFIAARADIRRVMKELRRQEHAYKRIMIAGGGNIGELLAESIESRYHVKVIEVNPERCRYLSDKLERTVVLQGDAASKELLSEESIEETDVFCAVTDADETNIMASMLAKRLGARKVMTLIKYPAYTDIVQESFIDIAISPQLATIGSLLTHVRRGDVVRVHSLRKGAAEALEAVAHGDSTSSKVVGRYISEIKLPKGTTIGAVIRGDKVMIASDDIFIEADDHVIMFLIDKSKVLQIERLFAVGLNYF